MLLIYEYILYVGDFWKDIEKLTRFTMEDRGDRKSLEVDDGSRGKQSFSPIAIVGMGLRLPGGVDSASSLWELLINKRNGRCKVPSSRYNVDAFYKPSKATGSVASKYGYFLHDDVESFDASFFSMSKSEVDMSDPQQRMLLEVVWECMESGGQTNWRGGNTGCYVGVFGDVGFRILKGNMPISNPRRIGLIWERKMLKMLAFIESQAPNRWVSAIESAMSSI